MFLENSPIQFNEKYSSPQELTHVEKTLNDNWKEYNDIIRTDIIWLAEKMFIMGLLSYSDYREVTDAKSCLSCTNKAEVLLISLKGKLNSNCEWVMCFKVILQTKPEIYSRALHLMEPATGMYMCKIVLHIVLLHTIWLITLVCIMILKV